jgi:hypothetical protein
VARWLAFLAVAGCYNPSIQEGSACVTTCPGDLVCISHRCVPPGTVPDQDADIVDVPVFDAMIDAKMIDGPPGDADADGITDNVDNCPGKTNADQHDEDADAIGDVCDPCPHIAGNAADGDGDGVGDACDPQPAIAKQRIAYFDPFTSTKAEWSYGTGASRLGETFRLTGNAADAQLLIPNGEVRVETGGTIAAVQSTTPHQLSIEFGVNTAGDKYHYVELYDDGGSQGDISISKGNSGVYSSIGLLHYPNALPTGAWSMRFDESVAAQQIKFLAKVGGVQYTEITGTTNTSSPSLTTSNRFRFYMTRADVRFDYWIVIETLP